MFAGVSAAYGTPEGLITMTPRSRSMPLTLPQV